MMEEDSGCDYDWTIIGSGFSRSVAALGSRGLARG